MQRITDEVLKVAHACRDELKQLEQRTSHYSDNKTLNEEEYAAYQALLKECHDSMRKKIHLLTTMLETDSVEILEMVRDRQH